MSTRSVPALLAGSLLVAASAVLVWSSVAGTPQLGETLGVGLFTSATLAVVDLHARPRRFGAAAVVVLLFAVADGLAAEPYAGRPWALPIAFSAYLVWIGASRSARAVALALTPALAALALALVRHGGTSDPLVMSLTLLPAAAVATAITVLRARAAARAAELRQHQADLDAVVMANLELRHVAEARDAADRIARIATDLLGATGAVVWLQGPGRLLCGGGHGVTPDPERAIGTESAVERVLQTGTVAVDDDDELVIPITGSGGVFGAVTVSEPSRRPDAHVLAVLRVFGAQSGYVLERLRAVESVIDARYVDPVTGVGNRLAATASLATMRTGDALLLLSVNGLRAIRVAEGDARADLLLGQLGLHLRTTVRAGDVVARYGDDVFLVLVRDLSASIEAVVDRLLESWHTTGSAGGMHVGAALHFDDTTPLDTLDRATEALDASLTERPRTLAR